jgi:hypothetical protein
MSRLFSGAEWARRLFAITLFVALVIGITASSVVAQDDPPPPPPAPSASSQVGDTVTNTLTGAVTTVTALIVDPAGKPTAGDTAFVQTADGYSFLVKSVGETFYNGDPDPVAFLIVAISGSTVTVESDQEGNRVTADFEGVLTNAEFDSAFNSSGTPGDLQPPISVVGPNGVRQVVYGRDGSNGRAGALFVPPTSGGNGENGPTQIQSLSTDVNATSNIGWEIGSVGGDGGTGGSSYLSFWSGRSGGNGGAGGTVIATQTGSSTIQTSGNNNHGIFAYSRSGEAGDGGSGYAAPGGGTGGLSADGGPVTVNAQGEIFTTGANAHGIYALSVSNNGGNGGDQWGLVGSAGDGGLGGSGGPVTVNASGTILTQGDFSHGILAQSIGGSGGSAGTSGNLLVSLLGANDNGGNGSTVTVNNSGAIQTEGNFSRGIFAQSIGGGGGTGGAGGGLVALALGGVGSNGGTGGVVSVTNQGNGTIRTSGTGSDGIMAQSIGGSGATGANAGGLVAVGGTGSQGGAGSPVTVQNFGLIATEGVAARGIVAQSIGGGGGDGGSTGGMVAVGGSGAGGGSGSTVTVLNDGIITTEGTDAFGVLAQSIGGGGGNGGSSGSVGAFVGVAVGGAGGGGGNGGNANVSLSNTDASQPSSIRTLGARSTGVFVQSIGGGGGNGGGAVSVAVGAFGAASVAVGGSGGSGGAGGTVILTGTGAASVQTDGNDATGILLQSVGGGGGNGGYAVSVAVAAGPVSGSLSVGVGGSGGSGGTGGEVRVGQIDGSGQLTNAGFSGNVVTEGERSTGMMFQSVGGGGGNGGIAVAAAGGGSLYFSGDISVGVGGSGATGGAGGLVRVFTNSSVTTLGDYSSALIVQSVGGGGGNGGGSVSAGVSASAGGAAAINVGVGGRAGVGSQGGNVDLIAGGASITTQGRFSHGVVAQSIGGGGGNGGYTVAAGAAVGGVGAAGVQVGVGGAAGGGGNGGVVNARVDAGVLTRGEDSTGVLVQSVGGGGGNGGFAVAAGLAAGGTGSGAVTASLGGGGGTGGTGGVVTANVNGAVRTEADRSSAVVVQSIGGGGGNGGFSVSGNISGAGVGSGSVAVGLGGSGGGGGNASAVTAAVSGVVMTSGDDATGILAQSVGGGGGNGGFNVSATVTGSGTGSGALAVGLGGGGGTGSTGGAVVLTANESVTTGGDRSSAIVAQSIGGGGGNGGFNVSGAIAGAGTGAGSVGVGLGGSGGGGGNAGRVEATANGAIATNGFASSGFVAQSIGGGGGNGGFNVTATIAGAGTGAGALSVGLGGSGDGGGNGGIVIASTSNRVVTGGDSSVAILAQSIGGGGGSGGFNVSPTFSGAGTGSGAIGVGIGGSGAGGGNGGAVTLSVEDLRSTAAIALAPQTVLTLGDRSSAVIAQSIGGGGGNGGMNVTPAGSAAGTGSGTLAIGIGGRGAGGGDGGTVTSTVTADIETRGIESTGLLVQSVGGGGGSGGLNVSAALSVAGTGSGGAAVGLGGAAGTGGSGAAVISTLSGDVTTLAETSPGVLVQSLGGGGGNGGINVSAAISVAGEGSGGVGVGIGGSGGSGGDGGTATGSVTGTVVTAGLDSPAVTVQSLGGGGGNGGLNVSGAISLGGTGSGAGAIGVGGFGGEGGVAGDVSGSFSGIALTASDRSSGVTAQSLGGGGGNGGLNISGAISVAPSFSGAVGIGVGGFGGSGGAAGSVDHTVNGYVQTAGNDSIGIMTQSLGGGGGNGGTTISAALSLSRSTSGAIGIGVGGFAGGGADAGETTVSDITGGAWTLGDRSSAIVTQSLGGGGGNGGTNISAAVNLTQGNGGAIGLGIGGFGGGGGDGKSVFSTVRTTPIHDRIVTEGAGSLGVLAQSVGGGGGAGGLNVSGAVSLTGQSGAAVGIGVGGFGGGGGNAGVVSLDVIGTVETRGDKSHGLFAQSLGGGGGVGGTNVSGTLSLTKPSGSNTILSASLGVGGFGGGGGDASDVALSYSGTLVAVPRRLEAGVLTLDEESGADGIVAQSIGGGGGDGGLNVSAGLSISSKPGAGQSDSSSSSYGLLIGVGGFGGTGGNAGSVTVDIGAGSTIDAHGTGRSGILAQSVGGGGGGGGLNVSGGVVSDTSLIVGVGGFGGNAGTAGDVAVTSRAEIIVTTNPEDFGEPTDDSFESKLRDVLGDTIVDETADLLESKGLKDLFTDLGLFKEEANPDVEGSAGLQAQSIGGGGGNGGLNVSGGIALSKDGKIPSITFGIGGFGGAGNISGDVTVDHAGMIAVEGNWKHGIFAQSIAGGGGNGGLNVAGQLNWNGSESSDGATDLSIVAGLGGHGGTGADAGDVTVVSTGDITTLGFHARGVFAQSIGGGGGTGGINVTAVGTKNSSPVGIGVGGFGSGGGNAGDVLVMRGTALQHAGLIVTDGIGGHGIEASSIGGGGGDAGVNAVLGFSRNAGSQSDGGSAGDRKVPQHTGVDPSVITNYNAVLDELEGKTNSTPPGGEKTSVAALIAIGGAGGSAGNGGQVDVTHFGEVVTLGSDSHGVFAQSLGGGGGNAALNFGMIHQSGKAEDTKGFGLAIGGGTGDGGTGGNVSLRNTGMVSTAGKDSFGIFAQSVGGGGGNASYNSVSTGAEGGSIGIQIGRIGGTGGSAGDVFASSNGIVQTQGERSHGVLAQSIGNGGGNSSATSVTLGTPKSEDDKGSSYSLNVGLEGGEGGEAGDVEVEAAGIILTAGADAHGIFAQSVGGGGGTGGGASASPGAGKSISLNIGGNGGTGGTGGAVAVSSAADIRTAADRATGILAQSIGGAGGTAGYAKSSTGTLGILKGAIKGSEIGTTMSINIGGTGGAGMTADTVDVTNDGTIGTGGANAHGIFAQSVGGGGGQGGAVEHNIVSLRGSIGNQATISVGGDGGTGAVSGEVTVTNTGAIGTTGAKSAGVFAQSVGGGGGDAQTLKNVVLGLQADNTSSSALLLGGSGGSGGAAGRVAILNDAGAVVVTEGSEAHGVFAQSVGGGGGNGGTVISVAKAGSDDPSKQSRNMRLAIGGSGGDAGIGGDVDVTNRGEIETNGAAAHGILAQSVGGGGGNGGASVVGTVSLKSGSQADPSLGLSLGGAGGSGNEGGDVTVENAGGISVSGDKSYGILAQSVGGGGGNGGMALALNTADLIDRSAGPSWKQIAIGGAGGDGADGGDVTVNHSGSISVGGNDVYGIFAQSVGGGGGSAGVSVSAPGAMLLDYVFSTVLGARLGTNGTGGAVEVNSTGDIVMSGNNAQAILAQSVNGGGGTVNTFVDFTLEAEGGTGSGTPPAVIGDVALGADDADGTAGNTVSATHDGDMITTGRNSIASLTQSIGGGGGQKNMNLTLDGDSAVDLGFMLGAKNTDNSGGGNVMLVRRGDVMTLGALSEAVSVQSIGGGGGRLTIDLLRTGGGAGSANASLIMGADPSFFNPGGDIDLDLSGDIVTLGELSPGLVVQSIGAGGGESYLTGLDTVEVSIGATDDSTGDGGTIAVTNVGEVISLGSRSDGIIVQSIGGGGGYVRTDADPAAVTVTANTDNAGDGGEISLVQTGDVYAMGDGSVAILMQSIGGGGGVVDDLFRQAAGGVGAGGVVSLGSVGNVMAEGEGGVAVFLQSDGNNGGGPITASLDGVIKGGSGAGAVAIQLGGGATNQIDIGTEGFIYALNDLAMLGGQGDDNVISNGQVTGNIDLDGGVNTFTNAEEGLLITYETVNLGPDGLLTNAGILRPGGEILNPELSFGAVRSDYAMGPSVAQTTDLNGSILMTPTSVFLVDASFRVSGAAGDGSDLIRATGDATIDGYVEPSLLAFERAGALTIIESGPGRGSVDAGATVRDTVVVDFSIEAGPIRLLAVPDFSIPGMTRNQTEVGDHINNILNGAGSASLGPLFAYIGNMTDEAEVVDTIDRLTTEGYAANRLVAHRSGLRFADRIGNCDGRRQGEFEMPNGDCWWVSIGRASLKQDPFDDYRRMKSYSTMLFAGMKRKLDDPMWSMSLATGFETTGMTSGDRFSSDARRLHLGVALEREDGPLTLGASLTASYGRVKSKRAVGIFGELPDGTPIVLDQARSEQSVGQTNLRLSAAYLQQSADSGFYTKPSIDFDASFIRSRSTAESGLGDYGMQLGSTGEWVLSVSPSVEVGTTQLNDNGTKFSPYLRGGFTLFNKDRLKIDSRFLGAAVSDGGFRNYTKFDQFVGRLNTGIVIETSDARRRFEVGYAGVLGENTVSHSVNASFSMKF